MYSRRVVDIQGSQWSSNSSAAGASIRAAEGQRGRPSDTGPEAAKHIADRRTTRSVPRTIPDRPSSHTRRWRGARSRCHCVRCGKTRRPGIRRRQADGRRFVAVRGAPRSSHGSIWCHQSDHHRNSVDLPHPMGRAEPSCCRVTVDDTGSSAGGPRIRHLSTAISVLPEISVKCSLEQRWVRALR